jgi:hypothetical protein
MKGDFMRLWILVVLFLSSCVAFPAEPPVDCRKQCTELKADSYIASWEISEKQPACHCVFNLHNPKPQKGKKNR